MRRGHQDIQDRGDEKLYGQEPSRPAVWGSGLREAGLVPRSEIWGDF